MTPQPPPRECSSKEDQDPDEETPTITRIVGVSGPSSSGKTTLSRALRDLFRASGIPTVLVHEDDFYLDESCLPTTTSGHQDWDSAESLNIPSLVSTLQYIRSHDGMLPPDLHSIEDQQNVPDPKISAIPPSLAASLKQRVLDSGLPVSRMRLAILDGFLLYSQSVSSLRSEIDAKLFLRTDYATAKSRREKRGGYVTRVGGESVHDNPDDRNRDGKHGDASGDSSKDDSEVNTGYWVDPPGYFDEVVWRNYVRDHSFLFRDGNVEGDFDVDVLEREGIKAMEGFHEHDAEEGGDRQAEDERGVGDDEHGPGRDGDGKGNSSLGQMLQWAVGVVLDELGRQMLSKDQISKLK